MKKLISLSLIICLALAIGLSACAKTPTEPDLDPMNPGPQIPDTATVTGVVIEASEGAVSVQAPDGTTYIFTVGSETKIDGKDDLGSTVEVKYSGNYVEKTNAIEIKVVKEAAPETTTAPGPEIPADKEHVIKYITGTIIGDTMHNVQVKARMNGETYTILKNDKTVSDENIVVGSVVRVWHTGNIKDGVMATKVILIADPVDAEKHLLIGTIVDSTTNSIIVTAKDGFNYTFKKTDKTEVTASISIGDKVSITYTGDVTDGPTAVKIAADLVAVR